MSDPKVATALKKRVKLGLDRLEQIKSAKATSKKKSSDGSLDLPAPPSFNPEERAASACKCCVMSCDITSCNYYTFCLQQRVVRLSQTWTSAYEMPYDSAHSLASLTLKMTYLHLLVLG